MSASGRLVVCLPVEPDNGKPLHGAQVAATYFTTGSDARNAEQLSQPGSVGPTLWEPPTTRAFYDSDPQVLKMTHGDLYLGFRILVIKIQYLCKKMENQRNDHKIKYMAIGGSITYDLMVPSCIFIHEQKLFCVVHRPYCPCIMIHVNLAVF